MAGGRPRQPNDPSVLASLEKALSSATRPNPVVAGWRWRYELALMLTLAAVTFAIVQALGAVWLAVIVTAAAATLALRPGGRRLLIRRAWCVITPHRLRTGCAHSWIQSRYGKLPVILFTTAQPFGERVLLWCVAGISAEDLRGAKDALIAACWAADMRNHRQRASRPPGDRGRHPAPSARAARAGAGKADLARLGSSCAGPGLSWPPGGRRRPSPGSVRCRTWWACLPRPT